jgi:protein-S-isoprenylcysteine O-methyltransferase Ste14
VDRPTEAPSTAVWALAWGGAALFVLSLSFFLFSYDISFRREIPGPIDVIAVVWNTVLFSVFALHHTLFARSGLRSWVQQRLATLERSAYVWVASLLFILVCALWRPVPGVLWQVYELPAVVLRGLHVVGIVLAIASAAAIDIWELAGVKQVYSRPSQSEAPNARGQEEFKTTGPYGLVRHPIYLGWFLIVFAVPHMTATRLVFAVVSSIYVLMAIPLEERSLLVTTGGSYERYRKKVRFRLLPGIY